MNTQSLARGLAFFSVGLGLAELVAPQPLARLIGVDEDNETLLRLLGVRELGAGLGMMQGNTATFLWSRVGGDVMDLGLLAAALRKRSSDRDRVLGAIAAVAGVTVLDVAASILLTRNPAQPDWRVDRDDRGGLDRDDPVVMRRQADKMMAAHASGHLRDGSRGVLGASDAELAGMTSAQANAREDEAMEEFESGD